MGTPPTFVAEYESAWNPASTSRSVSVTVAAGDYLVVIGAAEDSIYTQGTPTGGGLTYTLQQSVQVSNYCPVRVWTAPCSTSQTFTLSVALSGGSAYNGINVLRFSGATGIGASAATNVASGAPSLALTASADNSAIVVINADWTASTAARTWRTINSITPSSGNGLEVTYYSNGANYGVYGAYWNDAGTSGSKTTGLSAPTGQKYSIIAVEVLGTSGGATPIGLAESGSAADSLSVTAAVPLADGGSAAEAATETVILGLAEAGTGTDAFTSSAAVPLADAGAAADAAVVPARTVPLADAGSADEGIAAAAAAALTDSASSAEALTASVTLALADAGSAADTADNGLGTNKAVGDTGAAADSLTVAAAAALADAGSADDAPSSAATILLTDSGAGAESLGFAAQAAALADTGDAADDLAADATVALADTGTAADGLDNGLGTNKPLTEGGAAADSLTVLVTLALADAGSAVDAAATGAFVPLADTGSGSDSTLAAVAVPLEDVAAAAESLTAAAALALADAGAATDTAAGQDVAFVFKSLDDGGAAADILAFVPSLITGRPDVTGDPLDQQVTGDPGTASVTGVY